MYNVYGITGNALDWFRSYLTGRIQRVVIEDSVSVDQKLDFGVPQGSVLGPKMYCMYTKTVSDIIQPFTCMACLLCFCLPTPMTLASVGESDVPACGPPASFSVHLASSAVTPAGSVHKSRGDNVVRMWVQLKR